LANSPYLDDWIGTSGYTHSPFGPQIYNETIDIWPGAFDDEIAPDQAADTTDVDAETQALVMQLGVVNQSSVSDPQLSGLATKIYGRLIG
jgi:hypothetical protein